MSLGVRAKNPSTSTDRNALVDASEHTPMVSLPSDSCQHRRAVGRWHLAAAHRRSIEGSEAEGVAQGQPSILPSLCAGTPSVLTAALAPPPRPHRLPAVGGPRRPCWRRSICTARATFVTAMLKVTRSTWRTHLGSVCSLWVHLRPRCVMLRHKSVAKGKLGCRTFLDGRSSYNHLRTWGLCTS